MFVFVMLFVALGFGFKFFECRYTYKEAKQNSAISRNDKISIWGYGLTFSMTVVMIIFSIISYFYNVFEMWKNDNLLVFFVVLLMYVAGWMAFCIFPLALYIFTGIVHFSLRKPRKRKELSSHEDKIYKLSGIFFYIVTALLIWSGIFLVKVYTGQITFM